MFDFVPEKRKENNTKGKGLSWATNRVRWCTGYLKVRIVNKYFSQLRKQYNVIQYLGIAADEEYRLDRKDNQRKGLEFPLAEWGWTEKDCLEYCYSKGYKWGGLYEQFKRVSCWCCPLQPLEALRTLRKEYPDLWNELRSMDNRTWRQFRTDYSVRDLDIKFDLEDEFKNEGKSVRNKEFFDEYRRRKLGNKLNN